MSDRISDLKLLHPILRALVPEIIAAYAKHPLAIENGWHLIVAETWRSPENQAKGAANGTSKINGVTQWGLHQYFPAYAVDLWVIGRDKKIPWNKKAPWELIRRVAKVIAAGHAVTLRFGSDFNDNDLMDDRMYDGPHIELPRAHLRKDLQRALAEKRQYPSTGIDGKWGPKSAASATTLGLPTGGKDSPELAKALGLPTLTEQWFART